ncbi:unnamed protein product [Brugia pahangi]|uniref:Transposase n=1 Tax=Brugia pahangi TaxID=6280 RepID=A0A0N4TBT6_BRUPA|nr:unnamed protein product [Brugia pahangi]
MYATDAENSITARIYYHRRQNKELSECRNRGILQESMQLIRNMSVFRGKEIDDSIISKILLRHIE